MHASVAPHDIPLRMFCPVLLGSGVAGILQVVPSHTSARVWSLPKFGLLLHVSRPPAGHPEGAAALAFTQNLQLPAAPIQV
jgi:hypothetical protein